MKFISVIISIAFAIKMFAQVERFDSLLITKSSYVIKSSNTFYNDNFFTNIFCWNKYIKVKLKSIPNNVEINGVFKIIITDDNSKQRRILNLFKGNLAIDNKKKKKEKIESFNPTKIIKKNESVIIKQALRYFTKNNYGSAGYGYNLNKGRYKFYIEYYNDENIIKSNTVHLIVK